MLQKTLKNSIHIIKKSFNMIDRFAKAKSHEITLRTDSKDF